jgi:hypothetical protein
MKILIVRIPDLNLRHIFFIKEEQNYDRLIYKLKQLFATEFYYYDDLQLIIATVDEFIGNFEETNIESLLINKYKRHIEELNRILNDYSDFQIKNNEDDVVEDIKYHRKVIKIIRSICRQESISLAKEKYHDAIFHKVPGSLTQ